MLSSSNNHSIIESIVGKNTNLIDKISYRKEELLMNSPAILTSWSVQLDWLFRIALAALCGGAIGYERATQRKSAGIRTHVVVAVASALFMIVSKYGFTDILTSKGVGLDPSRIAAQIVTGISFIGAGTILVRHTQVSGLTTAAGVWAVSAIGMAIGAGMHWIGVLATIFIFIIQMLFHDDSLINALIPHVRFNITVQTSNRDGIMDETRQILTDSHVEDIYMKILDIDDDHITFNIDGIIKNKDDENKIIINLRKNDDIRRISYTTRGSM
jgi:putative Mg2+ transporter-C (MgtC) family protein